MTVTKVTDKNYSMDEFLKQKLDRMIKRISGRGKDDVLLIVDGYEGQGKTTLSVQIAYYISYVTGRPFNVNHVFFDLEKFIDFAAKTKEQIIIWDEAALGGLSTQWYTKQQTRLTQLLQVFRKKKHFIIFNVPRIYRLNERLAYDRALALIHVYSWRNIKKGYFCYYPQANLEKLYNFWKYKKKSAYKMVSNHRGQFTKAFSELIDEDAYDKKKDEAILSIANAQKFDKEDKNVVKLKELQKKVASIKDIPQKVLAERLNVSARTIRGWSALGKEKEIGA